MVLRPFTTFMFAIALVAGGWLLAAPASAADKNNKKEGKDAKLPTAEQVAEIVIYAYGSRPGLTQIRRNGDEKGHLTRTTEDGRTEEITYENRFVRGDKAEKDKVRLDQKLPTMEYALIYSGGRVWGVINGTTFTPRQEATADFLAERQHGIDALLRYKENGSTVTLVGRDTQKSIDMYVLDLTDKDKQRTRYYISAKHGRVLWLEYEEAAADGGKPIKYKKMFHDYRVAQGTLVPYRTVLFVDGKQVQETQVLTVTYGIKMEDTLFQNPEAATTATTTTTTPQ